MLIGGRQPSDRHGHRSRALLRSGVADESSASTGEPAESSPDEEGEPVATRSFLPESTGVVTDVRHTACSRHASSIPVGEAPSFGVIIEIPVARVVPSPYQSRVAFDRSIRTVPVNHSAGPFADGRDPLRLIFIELSPRFWMVPHAAFARRLILDRAASASGRMNEVRRGRLATHHVNAAWQPHPSHGSDGRSRRDRVAHGCHRARPIAGLRPPTSTTGARTAACPAASRDP